MELTVQLENSNADRKPSCVVIARTDQGDREQNQDAVAYRFFGDWVVCVLADGAGGHQGGETASNLAVQSMLGAFEECPTLNADALLEMVFRVNQNIVNEQKANTALSDMHTTLCALIVNRRTQLAVGLHVGDSRIYHFRQSDFLFRTKDHSVLQWITDHQPTQLPTSRNSLYTALGEPSAELKVEMFDPVALVPGDWFLLCSDGLWEHFSELELGQWGHRLWLNPDCNMHLHRLASIRANGRADNLSSIVLFVGEGGHSSG